MEMTQNVPLRSSSLEACDVPLEQEELIFLKAIEQGLIDVMESRVVSLSDARKHLGLKSKESS